MVVARGAASHPSFIASTARSEAASPFAAAQSSPAFPGMAALDILVIQHCPLTPVGLVGSAAMAAGARLHTVMPHHGEPLPADLDGFDGLILCGGPMHAGDDSSYPAFPALLRLIRRFHGGGRPVLGLCLGAQLIARAFGCAVPKWRELELGYLPLRLTAAAKTDRLLRGSQHPRLMQFHEDTFELPEAATLLITGDCPHQGFRLGDTSYGFQFHMEVTWEDAHAWLRDCRSWIENHYGAETDRRIAEVAAEIGRHHADGAAFTRLVTQRWVELVAERSLWRRDLQPLRATA